MTSGSTETDPKLRLAIDHWRSVTTANTSMSDNINNQMDLDILSNLRAYFSNKKS
jgi:hypothetical protein